MITSSAVYSQQPWSRVSPLPQENSINDATRIPGSSRLIAVGNRSTVMISDDDGETWNLMFNPAGMNNSFVCQGIHFISESSGFINGSDLSILKTIDGGLTWNKKSLEDPGSGLPIVEDVEFRNGVNGFATVDGGNLFETTDAGETWNLVIAGAQYALKQIVFADSLTGFIFSGNMNVLKTTDGGVSWNWEVLSDELPEQGFVDDCYFTNETTGFVFVIVNTPENTGNIYKTTDSGLTWSLVYDDVSAYSGKFAFYNEGLGMAVCTTWGYQMKVLQTMDGGSSWNEISQSWIPNGAANSIIYTSQTDALILGSKGMIFRTNDGGQGWQPAYSSLFSGEIFEARFPTEEVGYVLTDAGSGGVAGIGIKKTIDGGISWDFIYTNNWSEHLDFSFLSPDTGFCATVDFNDTLTLMKTTDGGLSFQLINTGFTFEPWDIAFYDKDNGLICGEFHFIRTTNGGLTWTEVTPGTMGWTETFEIAYRSRNEVFIAGSENYPLTSVFHSTDGGETWQALSAGNYGYAESIALPDENTILLTAGTEILISSDNGLTWNQATSTIPGFFIFKSLYFTSPTTGFASGYGDFTNIAKTTDGGNTWEPLTTNTTSPLNTIWFFDEENGLAFGDNGLMIRTATGGVTRTSIQEISETNSYFEAIPNPFGDEINIRQVPGKTVVYPLQLVLTDAVGRIILEKRTQSSNTGITIPGTDLKPGLYICRIQSGNGTLETLKLIKLN